ncbi:hypothetical protein ACFPMF_15590 [Larkinella bovis]|uniref:Uncharacterized protein n=1 Tax=Larkinella bovis TaxID=683041 RepID=A0ABW0IE46_9BACT
MNHQSALPIAEYTLAYQALRDTTWLLNPADPTNGVNGLIKKGETIWFHRDHVGSGPSWTQVCLRDRSLPYVHLVDFEKIIVESSEGL